MGLHSPKVLGLAGYRAALSALVFGSSNLMKRQATKQKGGAREMTPLLRTLFVLSEDPGLIARTHMW